MELQEQAELFDGIECSLEGGIILARRIARTDREYHSGFHGMPEVDSPDHILLGGVYMAVSSYVRHTEGHRKWLTNYQRALMRKHGELEGRDFALGVLTEVVRQEEDGHPDSPSYGDPGIRGPHNTPEHWCLLANKAVVEGVIYDVIP